MLDTHLGDGSLSPPPDPSSLLLSSSLRFFHPPASCLVYWHVCCLVYGHCPPGLLDGQHAQSKDVCPRPPQKCPGHLRWLTAGTPQTHISLKPSQRPRGSQPLPFGENFRISELIGQLFQQRLCPELKKALCHRPVGPSCPSCSSMAQREDPPTPVLRAWSGLGRNSLSLWSKHPLLGLYQKFTVLSC